MKLSQYRLKAFVVRTSRPPVAIMRFSTLADGTSAPPRSQYIFKAFILSLFCLFLSGCGGDSGSNTPAPESPRITNLKVDPETICVGTAADVSFGLMDPNQDPITWSASLSTTIHGTLDQTTGTSASGSQ